METKAEAHRMTVTVAAPAARSSVRRWFIMLLRLGRGGCESSRISDGVGPEASAQRRRVDSQEFGQRPFSRRCHLHGALRAEAYAPAFGQGVPAQGRARDPRQVRASFGPVQAGSGQGAPAFAVERYARGPEPRQTRVREGETRVLAQELA